MPTWQIATNNTPIDIFISTQSSVERQLNFEKLAKWLINIMTTEHAAWRDWVKVCVCEWCHYSSEILVKMLD